MNHQKRMHGFSLIELLIAILILSILLKIAVPYLQGLVSNSRVMTASDEFLNSLSLARAQAIRVNLPITVCASNSTKTGCGNNTNWSQYGWLTFSDPNGNGTLGSNANLLQVLPPLATGISFTTALSRITYGTNGAPLVGSGTYTINTPKCIGQNGRQINISATGRPSVTYITCA